MAPHNGMKDLKRSGSANKLSPNNAPLVQSQYQPDSPSNRSPNNNRRRRNEPRRRRPSVPDRNQDRDRYPEPRYDDQPPYPPYVPPVLSYSTLGPRSSVAYPRAPIREIIREPAPIYRPRYQYPEERVVERYVEPLPYRRPYRPYYDPYYAAPAPPSRVYGGYPRYGLDSYYGRPAPYRSTLY